MRFSEKESFSRRAFLGGFLGVTLGGEITRRIQQGEFPFPKRYRAYDSYWQFLKDGGFHSISTERITSLCGTPQKKGLSFLKRDLSKEEGNVEFIFHQVKDSDVIVDIRGIEDPTISLSLVEIEFEDLLYQVPILQTQHYCTRSILLRNVKKGENIFRLRTTPFTRSPIEDMEVNLYRWEGNPLFQSILSTTPQIGMRADNEEWYSKNENEQDINNNPLNDVPFYASFALKENSNGELLIEHWTGYSAEDGGSSIYKRKRQYNRLWDYEVSLLAVVNTSGDVLRTAYQGRTQLAHQIIDFEIFDSPTEVNKINTRLQSIGDHGMLSPENISARVFSLVPDIPWLRDPKYFVETERSRRIIAAREYWDELHRNIRDYGFRIGDDYTLEFLAETLDELNDPLY